MYMAKILLTSFLLFVITSSINGLPLESEWKRKLPVESIKHIGCELYHICLNF